MHSKNEGRGYAVHAELPAGKRPPGLTGSQIQQAGRHLPSVPVAEVAEVMGVEAMACVEPGGQAPHGVSTRDVPLSCLPWPNVPSPAPSCLQR